MQLKMVTETSPENTAVIITVRPYPVIVAAVNVPGHAKVSDLDQQAVAHQAVASG